MIGFPVSSDKVLAKTSLYRRRQRFYIQKLDLLNSNDFLIYTVDMYASTEQEANHSKERTCYKFVFPVKWCFSPINSWEFSYQYDELVETSTKSPTIKKLNASESTKYYLSKRKKVTAKEENSKSKKSKITNGGI